MAAKHPHLAAYAYVNRQLESDTTLRLLVAQRIYAEFAPEIDPDDVQNRPPMFPYILFFVVSTREAQGMGKTVLLSTVVVRVMVRGERGGFADISPIFDRIDALLPSEAVQTVDFGGTTFKILGCRRDIPYSRGESLGGIPYYSLGADYRIEFQVPA